MAERKSVVCDVAEAASYIKDGDTIGIGGFVTTNKPMSVIRHLIKERRSNLTVMAFPSGIELDLMIGLGMVKRTITPYVGLENLAPVAPFFQRRAAEGEIEVQEVDLGTVLYMLKARIMRLPFVTSQGLIGTSIPELNSTIKWVDDPFGGPPMLAIPPANIDVAIIHAAQADRYGNVQHLGQPFGDNLLAHAAKKVIAVVERLVSNEEIRRFPRETTIVAGVTDAVVVSPYGAHPCASQNYYRLDASFIKMYVDAVRAFLKGDRVAFEDFVASYIDGPTSHADYMQRIGFERVFSLAIEQAENEKAEAGEG